MKTFSTFFNKSGIIFLLVSLFPSLLFAQWSSNTAVNTPVIVHTGQQVDPAVVSDGFGGMITVWWDLRGPGSNLYMQRHDANGYPQWAANGLQLTTSTTVGTNYKIISDNAGGAIVVWEEQSTADIYAQRINSQGTFLWSSGGQPVCTFANNQTGPTVTAVNDGIIIAWTDQRNGGISSLEVGIYAQKLNWSGVPQWATDGVLVIDLAERQWNPRIVDDGANGAIIVMEDYSGANSKIIAQKINSSGATQWAAVGIPISSPIAFDQLLYGAVSDDAGGAIALWADARSGVQSEFFSQRIDNSGTLLWNSAGLGTATGPSLLGTCSLVPDGASGAYFAYSTGGFPTGHIYSQRVNSAGTIQWPGGVLLSSGSGVSFAPSMTATSDNMAAVAWPFQGTQDVYAQKINASGTVQWTAGGAVVSNNPSSQFAPVRLVSDGSGGAIIAFDDTRNGLSDDIYAQQMSSNGSPGTGTFPAAVTPNLVSPANSSTVVPLLASFDWDDVSGATSYTLTIATDNNFTSVVQQISSISISNYTLTAPLDGYTDYFWKVRAHHGITPTGTSTVWQFQTALAAPTQVAPANLSTGNTIHPLLTWNAVNGATGYRIQFSADAGFTLPVLHDTVTSNLSLQINDILANNAQYYWRIKAFRTGDTTAWSTSSFFTIEEVIPYLNHPINNATVYSLSPDVYWQIIVSAPGIMYDVQYSQNNQFLPGSTTTIDAGSATTIPLPGLSPGTHYYWRVRTKNVQGPVTYSIIQDFTTYGDVNTDPTPTWPVGGATVYVLNPTLYWYLGVSSFGYTFEVRVKPSSSGIWPAAVSVGNALSYTLSGLLPGTSYDWQVRAANGLVQSNWSAVQTFETYAVPSGTPVVPTVSYPVGGVTVYTLVPYLYWYLGASNAGLTFDVELRTDMSFTGTPTFSGLSDLNVQTSSLIPGTTYYFRVRSDNGSSQSSWSAAASFVTFGSAGTLKPFLSYPVNNQIVYTTSPTLYWYTNGYAPVMNYELLYSVNSDFTGAVSVITSSTSAALSGLVAGTTYYWKVRTHNGTAYSDYSDAETFTITGNAGSLTPILSWPVGGAASATTVYLYWYINGYAPVISYQLEYATESDFSNAVVVNTSVSSQEVSGLIPGNVYYWRVRTYNGSAYSPYSGTESFTTYAGSAPVRPNGGSPVNSVLLSTNTPVISWFLTTTPPDGLTYELQYSVNPDFSNGVTIENINSTSFTTGALAGNIPLYWRVRSKTGSGIYSAYSKPESFIPATPTGAESPDLLPSEFALGQNYPNPFNPSTVITFALPVESHVTVRIYDMLGSEIKTLVSEVKSAGTYSMQWDGTNYAGNTVSAGTYLYRITAGEFSQTKKMILLK